MIVYVIECMYSDKKAYFKGPGFTTEDLLAAKTYKSEGIAKHLIPLVEKIPGVVSVRILPALSDGITVRLIPTKSDISQERLLLKAVINTKASIRHGLTYEGCFQRFVELDAIDIWNIALEEFRNAGYRVEVKKCKERRLYSESRNSLAITVKFPHIEQEAPTPHD